MASIEETLKHINETLKSSSTPLHYSNYSCKTVSWDDVQRGTVGGSLSCWGANITDTRLYAKDSRQLFTVRGDNWNERLGKVSTQDVALVASKEGNGGGLEGLQPVTLRKVLQQIGEYGEYAGLDPSLSLSDSALDDSVSIRFQTTFLPVDEGEKTALEFAPEAYNYNTTDDKDPRNIILLCTTQGLAIQQDGKGAKKLYHHVKENPRSKVRRYWLEAESSKHKVGGSQVESKEEREEAILRGKATSSVIGIKGMGTRFNVLMTIQIPLEQKIKPVTFGNNYGIGFGASGLMYTCSAPGAIMYKSSAPSPLMMCEGGAPEYDTFGAMPSIKKRKKLNTEPRNRGIVPNQPPKKFGKSSAARVSRGSLVGEWDGLTLKEPKRHRHEHVTVTIVMYYTCSGGVPTEEDVKAAIDDLEDLYKTLEVEGNLSSQKFDFMKSELTVKDMIDIKTKVENQPPPKPTSILNYNNFPM